MSVDTHLNCPACGERESIDAFWSVSHKQGMGRCVACGRIWIEWGTEILVGLYEKTMRRDPMGTAVDAYPAVPHANCLPGRPCSTGCSAGLRSTSQTAEKPLSQEPK